MNDFTFKKVKEKAEKGQFLNDTEKKYLTIEAKNAALSLANRWGHRGAAFLVMAAQELERMGFEQKAEEENIQLRKADEKPAARPKGPSIGRQPGERSEASMLKSIFGGDDE